MTPFSHSKLFLCGRLAMAILLVVAVILLTGMPTSAAPLQQGTIHQVYISNVTHNRFVVSWTTDDPCTASVNFGTTTALGSSATDDLNPTTSRMHYVTVYGGLTANTTYYFDTISGSTTDNNGGAHYTVTTGPNLGTSIPSYVIEGTVYDFLSGPAVPNAIVYLTVNNGSVDSQLIAVRADSNGVYNYDLGNLRTADLTGWFNEAPGDPITLTGQGGDLGTGQQIYSVPAASVLDYHIFLSSDPNAVNLSALSAHSASYAWMPVGLILFAGLSFFLMRKFRR